LVKMRHLSLSTTLFTQWHHEMLQQGTRFATCHGSARLGSARLGSARLGSARRKHRFVCCCIIAGACFNVIVLAWRKYATLVFIFITWTAQILQAAIIFRIMRRLPKPLILDINSTKLSPTLHYPYMICKCLLN
jgi:hypothetical protein